MSSTFDVHINNYNQIIHVHVICMSYETDRKNILNHTKMFKNNIVVLFDKHYSELYI